MRSEVYMLVNEEKLNMKKKLLKPYLIDGGFYGNDNKWNALVSFPFDPNVYRDRVETIIIRDQKEVFVKQIKFFKHNQKKVVFL